MHHVSRPADTATELLHHGTSEYVRRNRHVWSEELRSRTFKDVQDAEDVVEVSEFLTNA
jgi:hypothetical protein